MNGWLDDVLGAYLERVSEREFDPVFLTYLRAAGYADIHQLHGAFEFGKDFIAKRDGCQWTFQTKAGDLNLSSWRDAREQVEEMLWNDIAHPSFAIDLPRVAVLVTTGRLVGGAAAEAQQYESSLVRRGGRRNDISFDVWDREDLLHKLSGSPEISLNGWGVGPLYGFLELLAEIERRDVSLHRIERASRDWPVDQLDRSCLVAAIVGSHLVSSDRHDLACAAAYALIRSAATAFHGSSQSSALAAFNVGRALFEVHADGIRELAENSVDPAEFLPPEPFSIVTYPARCFAVLEALGMLGLLHLEKGEHDRATRVADVLANFIDSQPGASHPISDRAAVALIPASCLLYRLKRSFLTRWLEQVVVWVCDRYEQGSGLASVYANPMQEVTYLLGDAYEHVDLSRRYQSFLAAVVLDLASVLELRDLYHSALNDFLAVDIAFPVMEPLDHLAQYSYSGGGAVSEANMRFDEAHDFDVGWQSAMHHRRAPDSYLLQRSGRVWELMAVTLLLRDRHFLSVSRQLAGMAALTGH